MANISVSSKITFSSLLLPLLLLLLCISTHADPEESQILLQIKQDLGNPPELDSWNTTGTADGHCNWLGIKCNETTGTVTEISFSNLNFTKPVPTGICDLANLMILNLSYNYFPGNFPTHLYNCSRLQYLDMSQNYFVGPIPSDIDRLSHDLLYLDLGANNFSGDIPAGIGLFPALQVLKLYQNQFNGSFPIEIGNLSNLVQLQLPYNSFIPASIPPEFGRLKKLQDLWMTEANLIGEIPESIGELPELKTLDLSSNNLTGKIPNSLFQLKKLQEVLLFYNKLSGGIPSSIQALGLTAIDLSINHLTGTIPDDIGKLENLTKLFLYANRLSGQIPASIARIPALTDIRLFRNILTGPLPTELGLHSKLENFEVSENQLSGELPGNFCASGVLTGFVVFSNKLTGVLPKFLGECPSLKSVQLHENQFSGEIPPGLWTSENLTTLFMNDNLFSGGLTDKLAWNLSKLRIQNNRFTGDFPSKISFSRNLGVILASNNLFSGYFPVELTALTQLTTLWLDNNRISGEIPEAIISWKSLTQLNLSHNNFTGKIPPAFGRLPVLNMLDMSENQFSGNIPPELGHLKLNFLNLSANRLIGKIPVNLESPANDRSFLDNPDLCTGNPILNLRSCISEPENKLSIIVILTITGIVSIAVVVLALFLIREYRKYKRGDGYGSWKLTSFQIVDFTESNILGSLTENNLIGKGGGGKVYRVAVGNREGEVVAVKKIWTGEKMNMKKEREFQAEVETLGMIRHANIVKLLCCISGEESKLLVYEYMENGSLDQWLHGRRRGSGLNQGSVLDWPTRFKIALSAAQGLCYMHHSCSPSIVHRDVKSSNILLDSEFKARIADFGLARMLSKSGESDTMTAVAGSFGYIAPEYGFTRKVSEKSDVYSFGVVLLELVTGRAVNDGRGQANLVDWTWRHFQDDEPITDAFDKEISDASFVDEMSLVLRLGLICTNTLPSTRPSMKDVVQILLRCGPNQPVKKQPGEYDGAPLLRSRPDGAYGKEDDVFDGAHNV